MILRSKNWASSGAARCVLPATLAARGKSAPTDAIAVASANSQAPDPDQALFGWIVDTDDDSESGSESESDSCDESGRDSGRDSAASDYYDAED